MFSPPFPVSMRDKQATDMNFHMDFDRLTTMVFTSMEYITAVTIEFNGDISVIIKRRKN